MTEAKTDRDLLELAAKAAGIRYDKEASKPHPKSGAFWGLWLVFDGEPPEHARRHWNPLTDDGDALRLAVKLRLRVCTPTTDTDCALASNGDVTAYSEDELSDTPMSDLYAATRRAIVRAIAEIGEAMK